MKKPVGGYRLVSFPDEFSDISVNSFIGEIKSMLRKDSRPVLVDCGDVEMMYSSGLGLLIQGYKLCNVSGAYFGIVNVNKSVEEIIKTTKMDKVFNMFSMIEEFHLQKIDEDAAVKQPPLDFSFSEKPGEANVLECCGIMSKGPECDRMVEALKRSQPVLFDFSRLDFIDMDCVRDLDSLCRKADVFVFGASSVVLEQIDLLGLSESMTVCDSLDDAREKSGG